MGVVEWGVKVQAISYDCLAEKLPVQVRDLETLPMFEKVGWVSIAINADQAFVYGDTDCMVMEALVDAGLEEEEALLLAPQYKAKVDALFAAFPNAFDGLTLELKASSEAMDSDREVQEHMYDGCLFCVNGVYVRSPAGEKHKDVLSELSWVEWS